MEENQGPFSHLRSCHTKVKIGRIGKTKTLSARAEDAHREFVGLFEDGAFQAARALTDERKEHIAALLKNNLSCENPDHVREKQLLSLLGQLNNAKLVILKHFGLDMDPHEAQSSTCFSGTSTRKLCPTPSRDRASPLRL